MDNDEDYERQSDLTSTAIGRNGCRGTLAIIHKPINDPLDSGYTRTFEPRSFRNTWRVFRRRSIERVDVYGRCGWSLYPLSRFRGQPVRLNPGFGGHVNFIPKSIAQL